jgi:hypothetical protein
MKSYGRDGAQPQPHFLKIILTTVSRAVARRRRGMNTDAFNREKHQLRAGFFPLSRRNRMKADRTTEVSKLIQPRMDTNEIGFGLSPRHVLKIELLRKYLLVAERLDCGDFSAAVGTRGNHPFSSSSGPHESAAHASARQTLREFPDMISI